jgi:xylose isomerase
MRNYLILKEKARQFDEDQEIKGLLADISNGGGESIGSYSTENAKRVKEFPLDRAELARKTLPYERLDQLTVDILLGVRG